VACWQPEERVCLEAAGAGQRGRRDLPQMGIAQATFFNWKKKYSGLGPSELRRLKQLEEENRNLKRLVADLSLDKSMLQDVVRRKL